MGRLNAVLAGALSLLGLAASAQSLPGAVFPSNNIWNTPVDTLPVHSRSTAFVGSIGATRGLHPDFGTTYLGAPNGIPYVVVPANQPMVNVSFDYADESDPGPYPIPPNAPIEGGASSSGDRHVLVVRAGENKLYELYDAHPNGDGSWSAGSGAVYDLGSNALRPETWTSADAAGLPILPGLVRYEEVAGGYIPHAIRFTAQRTRRAYVWPARHYASSITDLNVPAMGQRFRLKASFDISGFSPEVQTILRAMKKFGVILADNGSNWYISGAPNPQWDDDALHELGQVHGSDFEAVDVSTLMLYPNSGQARQAAPPPPPPPPPPPAPPNAPIAWWGNACLFLAMLAVVRFHMITSGRG